MVKRTTTSLNTPPGISRADELGSRYGLRKPPELTAEIASRRWRELNRFLHSCMVLHGMDRDSRPIQRLLRTAGSLVGASRGIFYVRGDNASALEMAASLGYPQGFPERLRVANEQAGAALRAGKPLLVSRPVETRLQEEMRLMGESSCVSVPVLREGRPWGIAQLLRDQAFGEDEAVLLWMYALVVEDALPSLVRSARAAEVPASEPDPAGLVSPSVLEAMLDREMECLRWGGQSCTLLRISLHPKEPPDPREEILLQGRVLQILRRSLRPADAIAPEPTGDLLVLLPEMGAPEGQLTAQKVRRSLIQSRVLGEESRVIRALKIAQATCPEHGRCREELMRSLKSHT